jgi:hypothetical protein
MFTNPTQPNIADFNAFALSQGVPASDLPSGTLATVSIGTSGVIAAASSTGTIAAGMVLVGMSIPQYTYIVTWDDTSGTVSPAPATTVDVAGAAAYSPYLQWALTMATDATLTPPPCMPPIMYVLAVYNYAMHKLLKIGQDLPGQIFFTQQRTNFNLLSFKAGPISASADQATSQTFVTPDFLKGLTMGDLDLLLTPWGRDYLDYSQQYGPSIIGVN